MIEVISPGLYSLLQDTGRSGYYSIGMPPSGALDQDSHLIANMLVGNDVSSATIEITFLGPELLFQATATVAVTGATLPVFVDGDPVSEWSSFTVLAGQILSFGPMTAGCRAYIAIGGGLETVPFLGSRSTYTTSGVGGLDGGPLKRGDKLPVGQSGAGPRAPRMGTRLAEELQPSFGNQPELRVVEGLCNYRFERESIDTFFSSSYQITPEANRTGYRLQGEHLRFTERPSVFGAGDNPSNVVDLGYPMGSIQVPDGAEPICLLRDAVTGGGYATLGTIIASDLNLLAQAKAPETVRFVPISIEQALEVRQQHKLKLMEISSSLSS